MDRTIKASLAIGILLIGFSVSYYFIFALPAIQKQRLDEQATAARWEREQQCSKAAAAFFNESTLSEANVSAGYDNHFNHKLNKCFIFVTQTSSQGDLRFLYKVLMDVNAGTHSAFAEYHKAIPRGVADYEVKPSCTILDKECHTDEEFNAFVKFFMEQ